jgi:hypothetical protein
MVQPIGLRVFLSPSSSRASSPDGTDKKKHHSPVSQRKDHQSAHSRHSRASTPIGRHVHASNTKHHSD